MMVGMAVMSLRPLGKEDDTQGWTGAKIMMSDSNFLKALKSYNKDAITNKMMGKVMAFFKEPDYWNSYRQFCEEMLGPFALIHYKGLRWGRLTLASHQGLPLDFISHNLPAKSWLNLTCLLHLHLHAKAYHKPSKEKKAVLGEDAINAIREGGSISEGKSTKDPAIKHAEQIINDAIRSLNMSATSVYHLANLEGESYRECLEIIANNDNLDNEFIDLFGVFCESAFQLAFETF
jgi:hypothetical protein